MTDTYSIKFTSDGEPSGKTAISVAPTAVDNSTSIPIHGKYSTPFGEDLWTSIVHVMENFCSATGPSPTKVTMGQLWFDSATQTLKVWKVLSVSPYTIGWAPVNPFNNDGTLNVELKTTIPNNGILDDSATYDNYFVTKGYSDANYLPKGNYVAGTSALSKAKLKYSTEVTFDTSDVTALVTKKYVDDKIGVVGQLSFTVAPDGSMTATTALIGSPDNLILDDTAAYNNYFITRDYADDRYFRVGTFVNSDNKQSKVKIRYSPDVVYASNTDDDYTLVHKKYVTEAISIASGAAISAPASGIVLSDGADLSNFVYNATASGKFLSVTASGLLSWEPVGLPTWLSSTIGPGVLVSNGTTVNPLIGTGDQVLKTINTGGTLSIGWGTGTPSWFPQAVPAKGVLVSSGTAVTSSIGTADSILTVDSSNTIQWVPKTAISGPTIPKTKGVLYVNSTGVPQVVSTEANDTVLTIDTTGAYKWLSKSLLSGSIKTEALNDNGYFTTASGFTMMWGSFRVDSNSNNIKGTQLFPVAFPTKCFQVIVGSTAGVISSGSASSEGFCVESFTNTGFSWYSAWNDRLIANQELGPIMFIAIGH